MTFVSAALISRFLLGTALLGATPLPVLRDRVNDLAGILKPADAAALRALLADLERSDSTQAVLLTVPTAGGRPIEDYAVDVFRSSGLGQKGKNNGVLVLVAVQDRRCRIEVGFGLEGSLTDLITSQIVRQEMVPRFKSGDFSGGARAGVEAVVKAVRGEYRAPAGADGLIGPLPAATILLVFIVVILVIGLTVSGRIGGQGGGRGASYWMGSGPSSSGGWSGGGSFSGGGGSSGGGGASGSW